MSSSTVGSVTVSSELPPSFNKAIAAKLDGFGIATDSAFKAAMDSLFDVTNSGATPIPRNARILMAEFFKAIITVE